MAFFFKLNWFAEMEFLQKQSQHAAWCNTRASCTSKLSFLFTSWGDCLCSTSEVLNLWGNLSVWSNLTFHPFARLVCWHLASSIFLLSFPFWRKLVLFLVLWNQSGELWEASLYGQAGHLLFHAHSDVFVPAFGSGRRDGCWCSLPQFQVILL